MHNLWYITIILNQQHRQALWRLCEALRTSEKNLSNLYPKKKNSIFVGTVKKIPKSFGDGEKCARGPQPIHRDIGEHTRGRYSKENAIYYGGATVTTRSGVRAEFGTGGARTDAGFALPQPIGTLHYFAWDLAQDSQGDNSFSLFVRLPLHFLFGKRGFFFFLLQFSSKCF